MTRTDRARDPIPHPRRSFEAYAALAKRLTPRDRWILRMLHEHRVFTTGQLADLAWESPITAAHRLLTLRRLGVITRWRPYTQARSAPWHWALDALGADILAAEKGITAKELGYRRDTTEAIFGSAKLTHQIGVNGFFTTLAQASTDGTGLTEWWPESRCTRTWGRIVRPDGYGRWRQHGRVADFFVEYDTGTETLSHVAAKLDRYADLANATGIITPVLLCFPTERREANFRRNRAPIPAVPTATTAQNPIQAVWAPLGSADRVHLIDLAAPITAAAAESDAHEEPAPSAWSTRPTMP
jgi:predicted transcriptional regulator